MHRRHTPTSKSKQKRPVRNTYDLLQIKKQIGKKLLVPWKEILLNTIGKDTIRKIKDQIIANDGKKMITITCISSGGVLHVIKGIEKYLAIVNISYDEIKKKRLYSTPVIIVQYMGLNKTEIRRLIQ